MLYVALLFDIGPFVGLDVTCLVFLRVQLCDDVGVGICPQPHIQPDAVLFLSLSCGVSAITVASFGLLFVRRYEREHCKNDGKRGGNINQCFHADIDTVPQMCYPRCRGEARPSSAPCWVLGQPIVEDF